MPYTGYQDQKTDPRKPKLPELLRHIDHGREALGLSIDWPEVDQARAYLNRADELRSAHRERVSLGRESVIEAGRQYASQELTAEELVQQAIAAASVGGETGAVAGQMIEAAALTVEAEGAPLLHNVTEAKWLKVIRPAVTKALEAANAVADEIGINQPRLGRKGVAEAAHPWAPTDSDLRGNMDLRHRWERLEVALSDLDKVYAYADMLRTWGLLPMVEGRRIREDYRWLRAEELTGSLREYRVFFLANRHTAEPGIYTAAEMSSAGLPTVRDSNVITDRYNAAVAAGTV